MSRPFAPRKSKLDQHRDIIGSLPDKEVAERAGVTAENVRTYRLRRGIPALWRGESAGASKPSAQRPAPSPRPRARRRSALDPYHDRLGRIPDRSLAELAGVSAENVRAYRKRHDIPAYWRGDGAPAPSRTIKQPAASTVPRPAAAPTPGTGSLAYRVVADVGGQDLEFVTFGVDVAHAAQTAGAALAEKYPGGRLRSIAVVGVAL